MKENVVIVSCAEAADAEAILKALKKKPKAKGVEVSHAAIVKKEAGELNLVDGFVAEEAEGGRGLAGGIVGGLVGLLTGPVGLLIGGGVGALVGGALDKGIEKVTASILEKASECLVDGETAVLLMAECKDEAAVAGLLEGYQVSITCLDAVEIAGEIVNE